MAHGRIGRTLMGPLLIVIFVVNLIIVALAGWSLNKYIDGRRNHPHLGGNGATPFMLTFALLAGTLGICSLLPGCLHSRAWQLDSMAAAASSATTSWAVTALAFGLVWKEIRVGGRRGKRLQTLEVFVIISTLIQMLYLMLIYAGSLFSSRYGPCYGRSNGSGREPVSSVTTTTTTTIAETSLPVSTGSFELEKTEGSRVV